MTINATRGVAHDDNATLQQAVADDAPFAVVPPSVLDLDCDTGKDQGRVYEVEARSASVLARLAGSKEIRMGYCIYSNPSDQALPSTGPSGAEASHLRVGV